MKGQPPDSRPNTLSIDWNAYLPYLESSDLNEAEKREFIETLWSIMMSFVDLGWTVTSPETKDDCGDVVDLGSLLHSDVLSSPNNSDNDPNESEVA